MVRTVYSGEACLQYLEKYAAQGRLVVGLVLGQTTDAREIVIHLARTPEEKPSDCVAETSRHDVAGAVAVSSVLGVSEAWVADHARHVTRMLPGGMFVLGIFVTCAEDIFDEPNHFSKVRNIVNYTFKSLDANEFMYGNSPTMDDRLVLHMSTTTKVMTCKSVSVGSSSKSVLATHVDWKFLPKNNQWQRIDCCYEFDEVYPIVVKNSTVSVKHQFNEILKRAVKAIETSVLLVNGQMREGSEPLDHLGKRNKTKGKVSANPPKTMHVSLFVPFENSLPDKVEYLECEGSIHFSGVVSSSVFMYPKATIQEAIAAVKQDIVRSLASRFTMHCDALIDDNLLPEEKVCFNEPPRRVLVPLRQGGAADGIFLCDYLFPGETPAEALVSVSELLDIELVETDVVSDLETPADTAEFDALDRDTSSEELATTPQETSQLMYISGIAFALLVLIVSIVINYYPSIVKFFS